MDGRSAVPMSWQLQHLEALASTPAVDIAKAEQGCLDLSHFLAQAPTDFLEPLLGSSFGRVYRLFLERCCTEKFTGVPAEKRCNDLSQRLRQVGCETPEGHAVLLALFPYPPNQLRLKMPLPNCRAGCTVSTLRYEKSENSPPPPLQNQRAIQPLKIGSS